MHKKDLEQMEKYWEKYHKSIPDYPLMERRHRKIHSFMTHLATFLVGTLVVLITWAIYLVRSGL